MEQQLEKDIANIKEFVRHSGEFLAYVELTDTKLKEWQTSIEHDIEQHHASFEDQCKRLNQQLFSFEEVLTQAGVARFKVHIEQLLKHSETQLEQLQSCSEALLNSMQHIHQHHSQLVDQSLEKLSNFITENSSKIEQQLSSYDGDHFRRTASESCDTIERVSLQTLHTARKLLQKGQWKNALIALGVSMITAFTIGLYVSDEWPWELHQQAMNERDAGKLLMKAWPNLSAEDRHKIMSAHS